MIFDFRLKSYFFIEDRRGNISEKNSKYGSAKYIERKVNSDIHLSIRNSKSP